MTVKRFVKFLVLAPVAVVIVLLAVANRAPVELSFDPFSRTEPALAVTVPFFVVIFAAVMLGVLVGGIAAWLAQGKHRKAEKRYRREADRWRSEAEQLRGAAGRAALPKV
ncbi:LapA family protein [Chelatococcus daeguensis]|uniref:Putative integral membrane protein n=1 Tax=Chelatococcus caeni TaxID=1348468 RepID=A0A840BV55_9HYPH|nr:LapA family protein [Chelatococcus daeguensis]MBB4016860.1 putative integral membrane protein [Chelatococcus caeni]MBM3082563.1 LapA family protein [Chelatococcus daeguensis]